MTAADRYERLEAHPDFARGLRMAYCVRVGAADPEDLEQEGRLLLWKLMHHYPGWEDERLLVCWRWAYRNRLFSLYRASRARSPVEGGEPPPRLPSNPWPDVYARLSLDSLGTVAREADASVLEAFRAGAESVSAAARMTGISRRGVQTSLRRLRNLMERGASHETSG